MADKIKAIKIKQKNGTYSEEVPISVNVQNVQWDENNHTLLDALGSVDISSSGKGNLQHQIDELDGDKISTNEFNSRLNDFLKDQISADTTDWLDDNVNPVGSAVIVDKTLTIDGAAADALAVKTELNKKANVSNTYTKAEVDAAIDAKQIEVDDTLSITGTAADAKAVGDGLAVINESLSDVRADLGDVGEDLSYTSGETKSGYKRIKHAYINSSGEIVSVSPSAIGRISDYDLICYEVLTGNNIESLTVGTDGATYGFFTAEPQIGSVSYNNSRVIRNEGTYTNISIPNNCTWLAIRVKSGLNLAGFSMLPNIQYIINNSVLRTIKTIGNIDSGDLNTYLNTGVYEHLAGKTVANSPADGGRLFVTKIDSTALQIYFSTRRSSGNYGKTFVRVIVGQTASDWLRIDSLDALTPKGVINSGDLNDYTDIGFYVHSAGTDVANAPDTGGVMFVGKYSTVVCQIYISNRANNEGKIYIRNIYNNVARNWMPFYSNDANVKIAFFGDSIVWGAVKTVNQEQTAYITTQASPNVNETIEKILKYPVTNYGVSGIGYLKQSGSSNMNLYELVQATDLTGYTHAFFMAGDNDSSFGLAGIGEYTDTTQNTIMGQMYRIMTYLNEHYPGLVPVIVDKNNKIAAKNPDGTIQTAFGTFPDYYYDFTYSNGFIIKTLFEETEKFCNYYHVGHISYKETGISSWILQHICGPDGTHYTQEGYDIYGRYLAGKMMEFL